MGDLPAIQRKDRHSNSAVFIAKEIAGLKFCLDLAQVS
jgi:hypothetical protein